MTIHRHARLAAVAALIALLAGTSAHAACQCLCVNGEEYVWTEICQ